MTPGNEGSAALVQSREFSISRVFDAPRELVWKALTEADRLVEWFSPKGFGRKSATVDLRSGGLFHYCMVTPDGQEFWGRWVYKEIVPMEKIVAVTSFSDEKGGITRHIFSETWPLEMINTMTLTEKDNKTTMTVTAVAYNATEVEAQTFDDGLDSMKEGFTGTFDQLDEYLERTED